MAPRLKVYATRIGFHDLVVAAPNQKAALAAWDVREDLFAQGAAKVADDPAAQKAALAKPGVVLSRAIGATGGFHAEARAPAQAPKVAVRPKPARAAAPSPAQARPAKARPDRRALDAAERALSDLEAELRRTREDFAKARRALDAQEAAAVRTIGARKGRLERERERLQRVYTRERGE